MRVVPLCVVMLSGLVAGQVAAQTSPWKAIGSKRSTEYTEGKFEGDTQKTGSYVERLEVYNLDDGGDTEKDWYRIDMSIESNITKYRDGGVCGWFTDNVRAAFKLSTSGGEIEDYGPPATIDQGSTGYSVGFGFGSSPKVSASYSRSQTVPDAGLKVYRKTTAGTIVWVASLQGCKPKYGTVGSVVGWQGASKISKTTYALNPSVVVSVPEGAELKFSTKVGSDANSITHTKSKITNAGYKTVSRRATYSFAYTAKCSRTSCSINRVRSYETN
ncbi:MAG: hypothetical protein GC201_08025 [Alphaproteobacteria bacterium]|nr:hypothetical protein [Alphaproteobacteria bacterium]